MRSIRISIVTCSYPGYVILPRRVAPSAKAPSNFTRNHAPNSWASASTRQTRDRGARNRMDFSIRSVLVMVGNLLVAVIQRLSGQTQPTGCVGPRTRSDRESSYGAAERTGRTSSHKTRLSLSGSSNGGSCAYSSLGGAGRLVEQTDLHALVVRDAFSAEVLDAHRARESA